MAKHIIKDKDGHYIELSDEEYKSRKRRNGCLGIIGLGVMALIATIGGGDNDSKKDEGNHSASSVKKEVKAIDKSASIQQENKTATATIDFTGYNSVIKDDDESAENTTWQNDNYETDYHIIESDNEEEPPSTLSNEL
ncbi:MAG: hypothetical protein IJ524_03480 [Bacteroidales bacterium]|nr:hypothetical protein [Bacteroidales bacterium]